MDWMVWTQGEEPAGSPETHTVHSCSAGLGDIWGSPPFSWACTCPPSTAKVAFLKSYSNRHKP